MRVNKPSTNHRFIASLYISALRNNDNLERTAMLVLGSLAGDLWDGGQRREAERIVERIEDVLGIHGKSSRSVTF